MTMTPPPSPSKPTPPADDPDRGSGSRPSQRRSRGAHDPSLLHDYIEASKQKDERKKKDNARRSSRPSVRTYKTSVEFRAQKSKSSSDADTYASGDRSADHASSFVSLSSTKICYDDDRSASGLFPVKGSTSIDSGVDHWRAAESAACSHTTSSAPTTQVDNRTHPTTHPHRGSRRSHRSPTRSQASSGFLELPHGGDLDDHSESSSDYGVFLSDESSAGSSGSEGSSVLWDHIEKRGRHTRSGLSVSRHSTSLESKERKRLKRSAMKVAHRLAKVVLGVFALSSVLIYLAFQADFESILDDVASTKSNLVGRLFGHDLVEADKKLDNSPLLRSRALPVQYNPNPAPKSRATKRAFEEAEETEEVALARERYLRATRQAYQRMASVPAGKTREEARIQQRQARTSGQTASGPTRNPREEAKTANTQQQSAQALPQRMLSEREVQA